MRPPPDPAKPYYTVKSLEKGLGILELLGNRSDLGVTEVARSLGESRSVCSRFLATLRDLGYVAQDDKGRYHLTLKIFSLGQKALGHLEIPALARPPMQQLVAQHNETVNLACLDNNAVVVVEMVKCQAPLQYDLPIGSRGPAHAQALGKALLAFAPPEVLAAYRQTVQMTALTPHTLTTDEDLEAELRQVREQGYALDREEWAMGIRCVAVPVLDYTGYARYALSVSGPSQRMTSRKVDQILKTLPTAAREISRILGAEDV